MSEVYAIFATIGEHIPFKKKEKIGEANSEGSINLLHYRATVLVIISFCLLVTSVDLIAGIEIIKILIKILRLKSIYHKYFIH